MTVANFLQGASRYDTLANCTDVNQIIAALNTALLAMGWTDEGGTGVGPYKSPVNVLDNRYIRITLARVSATRLRWICSDSGTKVINNQTSTCQDIDVGGTLVYIQTAIDLVVVDSARGTPETFFVGRLNVWPDTAATVFASFFASKGPRTDAGSISYNDMTAIWVLLPDGANYQSLYSNAATTIRRFLQHSGSTALIFQPLGFVWYQHETYLGCLPKVLMGDSNSVYGAVVNAPIDVVDSVVQTGSFRGSLASLGTPRFRLFMRAENVSA